MHSKYGTKIYGRYGFVDAFNPQTNWTDTDIIGINAGIILLSAENARTANVWRWFMRNREIPTAVTRAGLRKYPSKLSTGFMTLRNREKNSPTRSAGDTIHHQR
jgi:hypothetical protein